jgi:hypothetical protein
MLGLPPFLFVPEAAHAGNTDRSPFGGASYFSRFRDKSLMVNDEDDVHVPVFRLPVI